MEESLALRRQMGANYYSGYVALFAPICHRIANLMSIVIRQYHAQLTHIKVIVCTM
jgi:hypothetical protein